MNDDPLNAVFEYAPFSVVRFGTDGVVKSVNPGWERMWHATAADMVGRYNVFTDSQITGTALVDDIRRALKGETVIGEPMFYDLARSGYPGDGRWMRATVYPIKDASGQVIEIVVISEDVNAQVGSRSEITKIEDQLREVERLAKVGYWNWDIKTGDVEWSAEVYQIFRLDQATFKPQIDSILALSPWPEDHKRNEELIQRAIKSHEPGSYEQKFLRPDGSTGYYRSTFRGNYDDKGEVVSIVGTVVDITELKEGKAAQQQVGELGQVNAVLVGRELKMIELKKEIEQLKAELAKKP